MKPQLAQQVVRDFQAKGAGSAAARFGKFAIADSVPATSVAFDDDIVRLLSRTTFGYTEAELDLAAQLGFEDWLDYQLDPSLVDTTELDATIAEAFPKLSWNYSEIIDYVRQEERDPQELSIASELILATIFRQWFSPSQLYEVMVEFWTNHFNVFLFDGFAQYLKPVDDRDHIRPHALGKFKDLLAANARSPAMLIYLDNYSNTVDGPNENYARELLELHTLGVDGGYTEGDVKQVAKAFTGWTLSEQVEGLFVFAPELHDGDERQVMGTTIAAGLGVEAGQQVLSLLAEHPSTAHFVAYKLGQRFVADVPPESLVTRVAEAFIETDGDIKSILRTLFLSSEFRDVQFTKFKRPTEYAMSLLRRLQPDIGQGFYQEFFAQLDALGQVPFLAGPPTGYDDTEADWLNTSALLQRWNLALGFAFDSEPDRRSINAISANVTLDWTALLAGAESIEEIVDQLVARVLHFSLDSEDRDTLVDNVARGTPIDVALNWPAAKIIAERTMSAILSSRYFQQR